MRNEEQGRAGVLRRMRLKRRQAPPLSLIHVDRLIRQALAEDVGSGDVTTRATIPASLRGRGRVVAKAPGVAAGLPVAGRVFKLLDRSLRIQLLLKDGTAVRLGETLMEVSGAARSILTAERVALNFLQHLSGIATLTRAYVRAVAGTGVRILDTRKTTPGLRLLEKCAVRMGGGANHRMGLYDAILIKDNHIAAAGGVVPAIVAARRKAGPRVSIEVEARTLAEVREAVLAGADTILLDNMTPARLRAAVRLVGRRVRTEASGGVTLANVRTIARTGVDDISVGALTHSAPALDISLDLEFLASKKARRRPGNAA